MENQIWFQKYYIIKKIGHGGSADVFLAEHNKLKTLRAIKRISKDNILSEQLLKEAHILKNLRHPCIPIIYDFEEDAHNSYIIEQYIEGQTLKAYLQQCRHLSEEVIIDFAIQLCDLMQYLYSINNSILYLDLKPENIIINNNTVMLIDFGASYFKSQIDKRKYSCGTKGFAAPELYGKQVPDERTDIYGIGMLLLFMVSGNNINTSSSLGSRKGLRKYYSKSLYTIMKRCLHYYPAFRYSTVTVLRNKLLELKKNKVIQSSESISIALAGTQPRIGTTHLAFLITSYFNKRGIQGLYLEKNNSKHISNILKRYQNIKTNNGIYQLFNCNMIPNYHLELPFKRENYKVNVMDYGCINTDNLEDYLKSDIKLLIAGAKEWELEDTEVALKMLGEYNDIKYLFNFVDGKLFREISKYMEQYTCYRIPYEPNPFQWKYSKNLNDFLKRLVDD